MSHMNQNGKKWIAIAASVLLLSGGWMGWRAKHHTLSQSPQNLSKSGEGSSTLTRGSQGSTSQNSGSQNSGSQGSQVIGSNVSSNVGSNGTSSHQNAPSAQGTAGGAVVNGTQTVAGAQTAETKTAPVSLESLSDGCFTLTFTHKALATHGSDDECSHHRNLIKLPRTDAHSSSVCIRVNGTPVRHEAVSGKSGEFVIGAVAGPKDVVTARFCVGKAKCSEGCPYPKQEAAKKDEFLEAISGGSNEDTGLAQWEASDAQKNGEVNQALDGDLKKAVEEQELASQRTAAGNSKLEIFKDWIGGEMAMACGSRQAGEASRSTASVQVAASNGAQKPSRKQ